MLPLYPEIKPYARHHLKVDDVHELYLDESGTPDGIPVIFVHGGPGSGCEFNSRCFFNPEKYRIVLFDQRGAGRSKPHTELANNTTADLIADMEKIREFLKIDQWLVFGGGWGATLGLAYAEAHSSKVLGLILRGLFLGRQSDIDWLYEDGASRFYPDHWEDFIAPVEKFRAAKGKDLPCCDAYYEMMMQDNELARMAAAKAWSTWEAHASTLHPNHRLIKHFSDGGRAHARCLIANHYFRNECFLEPDQLLANAGVLGDIPGILVHGRFDCIAPMDNSHMLRRVWTNAQLFIVREAGHTATEPAMIDALIRATRDMALRFEADFDV
ncbi:MAG: prolyl aminopeptidase [Gammaproteobacteria bacterium]|jgi:proline iminopeptidase|nr:prolyl aminopeptidase [Gammaproteobacteria bacterium]MBT7372325.1 prolyl aminopeptidase [Gammaproteobacteria bacterium]